MLSPYARTQSAVVQTKSAPRRSGLPLAVLSSRPVATELPSPYHVLVRVAAVGLNPTDYKMVTHFYMEGNAVGCDFSGVVETAGPDALCPIGTRICGAEFPYRPDNPYNGACSEYLTADSRHLLKVPGDWSNVQAAALGAIGWGTAALAISDPDALDLAGLPASPAEKAVPVLVYGGGTATGLMAIQMLRLSGYRAIAVCSEKSAPLVMKYGAVGTASYTASNCVETIKSLAGGASIKHALDCITDAESAQICFRALARVGGRYACLEDFPDAWHTRKTVKVKVVMGFEGQGYDVDLGHPVYSRKANWGLHAVAAIWARELQPLLERGEIKTQGLRELDGGLNGVVQGLEMLASGDIRGEKVVAHL